MSKKKMAKPTKKKAPVKNGHNKKNGAAKMSVALAVAPPVPERSNIREITAQLGAEVTEFRDAMLAKYTNYEGHDLRKSLAWYMEQYGQGILSEMEREKRKERDKIIAANRIPELEKQLEDETLTVQHRESIELQLKQFKQLLVASQ